MQVSSSSRLPYPRPRLSETALRGHGIDPKHFESHLRMFDLGMPPPGGFAIGLERLPAQILTLLAYDTQPYIPAIGRNGPLKEAVAESGSTAR